MCFQVSPSYVSINSLMVMPSSNPAKTVATGIRVPRNTHAPLTFPGTLSTAGHCDQSSAAIVNLLCDFSTESGQEIWNGNKTPTESAVRDDWEGPRDSRRGPSCRVEPCCAKIPFSLEVDRYNGQPANNRLTFIDALLPEREPPVIVGLETAAEMNLVQIETNEFFPNSPLLNSRESSTAHRTGAAVMFSGIRGRPAYDFPSKTTGNSCDANFPIA